MSKINTKDVTNTSIGSIKAVAGKRNSGGSVQAPVSSPKDELKAIKAQIKELNTTLKGLERQQVKLQKQISKSKKA